MCWNLKYDVKINTNLSLGNKHPIKMVINLKIVFCFYLMLNLKKKCDFFMFGFIINLYSVKNAVVASLKGIDFI